MTKRTQLGSWLFASALFATLVIPRLAHAAEPGTTKATTPSAPKAPAPSVNGSLEENVLAREAAEASGPRLKRTEVPMPKSEQRRHVVNFWGLRIPTLVAYGLGGISAGGAFAAGWAASHGNDPASCDSRCNEHGVRNKALWVTTGVLTGLAATGVGIGFALMLKVPRNPTHDTIQPRLDLGFNGQKAMAKVGWVFSSF